LRTCFIALDSYLSKSQVTNTTSRCLWNNKKNRNEICYLLHHKIEKNTVEIVRYSTTSTASNLLITVKFQIQSLVSTQGHNDKFISGGAFSSVLSLRFTPSFSSPYISFTSKWPLKFSQDIWGALLASAAPSQSGKNDICSHQTRSMGSKYNQECVCGWAPCLLAANIVIFSVKLNTKIKADVVVSECTVCYHVVAY